MLINSSVIDQLFSNYFGGIAEASGAAVGTEFLMRIVGERCDRVQEALHVIQLRSKKDGVDLFSRVRTVCLNDQDQKTLKKSIERLKKIKNYEYNNCELIDLEESILIVFDKQLTDVEKEQLRKFRKLRNKVQHGDFAGLAKELGYELEGLEYISRGRSRKIVTEKNMAEAIFGIAKTNYFTVMKNNAIDCQDILKRLIKECIEQHKDCDEKHRQNQWVK